MTIVYDGEVEHRDSTGSGDLIVRLGDGTELSHRMVQQAVDYIKAHTKE